MPPLKFEIDADDPLFMKLAGPLMDGIAGPFNAWFSTVATAGYPPKAITMAACMAMSIQLKLISNYVARPGHEDEFAEGVANVILGMMTKKKEPDASHH